MKTLKLAGCIIENKARDILLIHRNLPELKQWEIPGGKIDPGETDIETAVREIKEELGIEVEILKFLGKDDFIYSKILHIYSWFSVNIISGIPQIREPETFDKLKYFSMNELLNSRDFLSKNVINFLNLLNRKI